MTDELDARLRRLDGIEAPDLSSRIGSEPERALPPLPGPRRRVMIGALAFAVAAAGLVFLVPRGSHAPSGGLEGPEGPAAISVSRMLTGKLAHVRCTASVPAVLRPGRPIGLTWTLRNEGDRTVGIDEGSAGDTMTISTANGEVYDTRRAYELSGSLGGPYVPPRKLQPGGVLHQGVADVPVAWSGPLTLVPDCEGTRLPAMQVNVAVPGATPSAEAAVQDAARALGGLFSTCRPSPEGTPTIGTIHAPGGDGSVAPPPMQASCSAAVREESGFAAVRLTFVTPPTAGPVQVSAPYDVIKLPPAARPIEVSVWEFEVDATGSRLIGGREEDWSFPARRVAPSWGWTGTAWEGPGGGECGTSGEAGGPYLVFISVCPTTSP